MNFRTSSFIFTQCKAQGIHDFFYPKKKKKRKSVTETFKTILTLLITNIIQLFLVIPDFPFHNLLQFLSFKVSQSDTYDDVISYVGVFLLTQCLSLPVCLQHFIICLSPLRMSLENIYVLRKLSTQFLLKVQILFLLQRESYFSVAEGEGRLLYLWEAIQV